MAARISALLFGVILCFSFVRAEVEDLNPQLNQTEETVKDAKIHVDHMLKLSPIPNEDNVKPIVKSESEHLAYEIKKLATKLNEKIGSGEHNAELKQAVESAVSHLNEAAATLEHVGTDLKADNSKYYAAVDKLTHEIKSILSAGACPEINPILKAALNEITHDVNNYQYGIHKAIGHHGEGSDAEHYSKYDNAAAKHHLHKHEDKSSQESSEESHSSHHHH